MTPLDVVHSWLTASYYTVIITILSVKNRTVKNDKC